MSQSTSAANRLNSQGWNLEHTYASLPDVMHQSAQPSRFPDPKLVVANHKLAGELGLNLSVASDEELAHLFAGQWLPADSLPIAQAYAGHQFGGFTMLGDGRAVLLGEQRGADGKLWDLQFKGSGETPFSRRGDGRAALGPMLREYIISEAMHALGIPSTRSLGVATTGESVYRETPLPGAVLLRVASSHIRVGTFQYLAAIKNPEALRELVDYTIQRHYSDLAEVEADSRYLAFLKRVIEVQAKLVAKWQLVGFVHGVMNTDNMAIGGETIDYGPCAFMDRYHPGTVFSSIDHGGRYAYSNQPPIAQWNLARFAETLIPLLNEDQDKAIEIATDALHQFPEQHESAWLDGMRRKLGLASHQAGDRALVDELLSWMEQTEADFTNTFADLSPRTLSDEESSDAAFATWHQSWLVRLESEGQSAEAAIELMMQANPAVIPRNHRVEEALSAAEEGNLDPFGNLLAVLVSPFSRDETTAAYRDPPPPGTCYRTFCGT